MAEQQSGGAAGTATEWDSSGEFARALSEYLHTHDTRANGLADDFFARLRDATPGRASDGD